MRWPAVPIRDRYILRELLGPFGLGVALFTFLLIIDRVYHLTDLVITKGVPFALVLQLLVFILPSFLALTLPMALLVAVLLAGGRLAGDLEIVAFKAAGVSVLRLFRPVLAAALVVMLAGAALTLVVSPLANQEFQRQLFRILQTHAASALRERVFNTAFGAITIYVEDMSASHVALRGILLSDERDPTLSRIITAREGRLLTDEASRRITLRMIDGAVNEADVTPADPPAAVLGTDVARGGAASASRYRYAQFGIYDMTLGLDSPLATPRGEKPERDLGARALRARISDLRGDAQAQAPFLVEWHKRLAFPVAAVIFVLVGFPLAVRSHRGGRSVALVGSLVILVSYYLVMTPLEGMALRGRLPPAVAIWLPNAIFGIAGAVLLVMTARERGGLRLTSLWKLGEVLWQRAPRRPSLRWRREPVEPRDSTHIVDRYLLREFMAFAGIGVAVAATLYVLIDLLQTLDRYLRLKPPVFYIVEHFVYRLPIELLKAMPIVMLVATIFLFLSLARYHELTALKAAGVSLYRVSAPILAVGLTVAIGAGLAQELIVPRLEERGEEVDRVKIRGQLPRHLQSRTRLWLRSADTRFYRVELLAPGTSTLYGMTLLEMDRDFRVQSRLDSRLAHWRPGGWELYDGAYREISTEGDVQTVPFRMTALALPETVDDFTQIQKRVTAMSYRELSDYVVKLEAAGFQVKKYLVDLYAKLSAPLENLIMVLIAIPFALQAPGGGRLLGAGLAIAIMVVYLVVDSLATALGRADLLPPLLAAWAANVIFSGVGVVLFARART